VDVKCVCAHSRSILPEALATIVGWEATPVPQAKASMFKMWQEGSRRLGMLQASTRASSDSLSYKLPTIRFDGAGRGQGRLRRRARMILDKGSEARCSLQWCQTLVSFMNSTYRLRSYVWMLSPVSSTRRACLIQDLQSRWRVNFEEVSMCSALTEWAVQP